MKEYENKKRRLFLIYFFFYFDLKKKKETLGLLNHKKNKYIKQRSHHSIFELLKKKEGW